MAHHEYFQQNLLHQPVEVIMAVRLADGTISCFQGTSSQPGGVTFEPAELFADPLASGGYSGLYSSRISWDRGVKRTFIRGADSWDWSAGAGHVPAQAEIEQGPKAIDITPGSSDMREYAGLMRWAIAKASWSDERDREWNLIPETDWARRLEFLRARKAEADA